MWACVVHKLACKKGFMLMEQLVSIVFIGLLCLAITVGMGAALSAYANMTQRTEAQALLNQAVQKVSDELAYSEGPFTEGATNYVSSTVHLSVSLANLTNASGTVEGIGMFGTGIASDPASPSARLDQVLFIPGIGGLVPEFVKAPVFNLSNNTWSFQVRIMQGDEELIRSEPMVVARVGSI